MEYLTVTQYAKRYGKSRQTVYRRIDAGKIPLVKLPDGDEVIPVPGPGETLADCPEWVAQQSTPVATSATPADDKVNEALVIAQQEADIAQLQLVRTQRDNSRLEFEKANAILTGELEAPAIMDARKSDLDNWELGLTNLAEAQANERAGLERQVRNIKAAVARADRVKALVSPETLAKLDGFRQWCAVSVTMLVEAENNSKIKLPDYEDYGIDEDFIIDFCNNPIIDIGAVDPDTEDTGQDAGSMFDENEEDDQ